MNIDALSLFQESAKTAAPERMAALTEGKNTLTKAKREEVAQEFEALFLAQMLQTMFPSKDETDSGEESIFGSQEGDEAYQSMMVEQYAKQIAKSGGIGIAEYISRELLKQQELSPTTPPQGA